MSAEGSEAVRAASACIYMCIPVPFSFFSPSSFSSTTPGIPFSPLEQLSLLADWPGNKSKVFILDFTMAQPQLVSVETVLGRLNARRNGNIATLYFDVGYDQGLRQRLNLLALSVCTAIFIPFLVLD